MAVKPVPDPRPEEPEPMFGPDVELIRALAAVLDEAGLTEIEIGEGANRIRIARQATAAAAPTPTSAPRPAAIEPVPEQEAPPAPASSWAPTARWP